jgi:hypothetical protein
MMRDELLQPSRLWTRREALSWPSPVPKAAGVYAWCFPSLGRIPVSDCLRCGDFVLLYIISLTKMARERVATILWHRVSYHMRGNAEGPEPPCQKVEAWLDRHIGGPDDAMEYAAQEYIPAHWSGLGASE